MEYQEVLRRRRMVRSFVPGSIDDAVLRRIVSGALRGPSAGFSQGVEVLVLVEREQLDFFFSAITTPGWLEGSSSHNSLVHAAAALVFLIDKQRYLDRYLEDDKSKSAWKQESSWPVPYWHFDAGAAVMATLLGVVESGLGALFLSIDRGGDALRSHFGIPSTLGFEGGVLIGHPQSQEISGSPRRRARREFDECVHFGAYGAKL